MELKYVVAQFAENLRRGNLGLKNVEMGIIHALLICLIILLE